ncbi:FAD-binding protein [Nocardia grenadensis]|uniref:FAD-binding oxidoreductase n=1 Tax=Nocardia grenadensis TaxID=931537 RepID=UPI003D904E86
MSSQQVAIDDLTTDFGGLRRAVPAAVHRMPTAFSAPLLGSGRPLTLRGAGHSCDGQTVTNGELLVVYSPESAARQVRDHSETLTEAPAWASWSGLERYLNDRGRSAPVLTDHLSVSVGGTLSAGGVGVGSVKYGMQVDQVERIQLIDGTGVSRWCSRTECPELFRFALGGFGTVGLIEQVVLRTVPLLPYTHVHRTFHRTTTDLAEEAEDIALRDDIDIYCASLRAGVLSSVVGRRTHERPLCRAENCDIVRTRPHSGRSHNRPVAATKDRVHLWTDFTVPAGRFTQLVAAVETLRHRPPLDRVLTMLYVLIIRRPLNAVPFAFAPAGDAPVSIGLGLYTSVDRDPHTITETRLVFHELSQQCRDLGGRPYLYGTHYLDASLGEQFYGPDLNRLAQLRSIHRLEHVNAHLPLAQAAAYLHRNR